MKPSEVIAAIREEFAKRIADHFGGFLCMTSERTIMQAFDRAAAAALKRGFGKAEERKWEP